MTQFAENIIPRALPERGIRVSTGQRRRLSSEIIIGCTKMADFATVLLSGMLAFAIYIVFILNSEGVDPFALTTVLGATLFVTGLHAIGGYEFKHLSVFSWQVIRIPLVWAGVLSALLMLAFITKVSGNYSRGWALGWAGLTLTLLLLGRGILVLGIRRWSRRGYFARNVVVVGAGEPGERLLARLRMKADEQIVIVGVFDDRLTRVAHSVSGYDVLGTVDDLLTFARRFPIDEVIVALPLMAEQRLKEIFQTLKTLPVDLRLSAESLIAAFPLRGISYLADIPTLEIVDRPLKHWSAVRKRVSDLVICSFALVAMIPAIAMIAIAIKLDSRGPVLFRQRRYGYNNNLIVVYKFRTLRTEFTDLDGGKLVTRNDNRVTRVGRFLRAFSLDELPQLFNVIKGDMAIVGPRPHATLAKAGNRQYDEVVTNYFARHKVKPGLTGWAQINGWRGETDTEAKILKRVEHDLYYIENWSIWFDIQIIAKTIFVVLSRDQAY